MDQQFERRRVAVMGLVQSVFARFEADEGKPHIGSLPDHRRWWRHSQEYFMCRQRDAWLMPDDLPVFGWLDRFPEMAEVRAAYAEDPVLGERVDAPLGTSFSRQTVNFFWSLAQHLLEPIVLATRSYRLDEEVFNRTYAAFESRFGADRLTMVEFRALNGFECAQCPIELPDGLVLQRMSESQISMAIDTQAVPRGDGSGVNSAIVSRFDQWALMRFREYPVRAGHRSDAEANGVDGAVLWGLDEPAERLVAALRLICGGSVVTTRSIHAQADDEFPFAPSYSAMLSSFTGADKERPTVLSTDAIEQFRATYTALARADVIADRSLQVALRRLVYSGTRGVDGDRLVDLMTAAEALFVKRANLSGQSKSDKISNGAVALLTGDPEIRATDAQLEQFMITMYRARNAEIHGDGHPYANLHLLSGQPTTVLTEALADAERVLRRAILVVLDLP